MFVEALGITAIAAFLHLDGSYFGQLMIGRPIVVGTLVGILMGDIVIGAKLGLAIELIWINVIPIGTTFLPDVTGIAFFSVFWILSNGKLDTGNCLYALALALPFGILSQQIDYWVRKQNSRYVQRVEQHVNNGEFSYIGVLITHHLFWLYIIRLITYLGIIFAGKYLLTLIHSLLPITCSVNYDTVFQLFILLGLAVTFNMFIEGRAGFIDKLLGRTN
ncbi:MAG: PTS sugar transporter subunit IIC [Elusimicrobiota bacterium]